MPGAKKVTICHATGSGYVSLKVDDDSILHEGHGAHEGDVIPAFDGFPGQGDQSLLASDCRVQVTTTTTMPETTTTTAPSTTTTTSTRPATTTTTILADARETPGVELPATTTTTTVAEVAVPFVPAAEMLPVTGASPILTGAGLGLVALGVAALRLGRRVR